MLLLGWLTSGADRHKSRGWIFWFVDLSTQTVQTFRLIPAQTLVGLEVRRRLAKARAQKRTRFTHKLFDVRVVEHLIKSVLRSNP